MRYPWVNVALLIVLPVLLVTGLAGLMTGAEPGRWILWLHGAAGYGLVLLAVWKSRVILDVLRRAPRIGSARAAFLVLTALTGALVATGILWTTAGPSYVSAFSVLTVHAVLGIPVFVLFAWHVLARRYVVRVRPARDRRAFLRFAAVALGGAAIWQLTRTAKAALGLPAAARRFTGSYQTGSLTGVFPFVSWLFDSPPPVDVAQWQLRVTGAVVHPLSLSYSELLDLPSVTREVTIDCTGGWHSLQEWRGVELGRLLSMADLAAGAASVTLVAATGYSRRFSVEEAGQLLLATHVAGRTLEHGHGYPLRLVAPGHRGFEWVKWVAAVEVNATSALLQPPLPLQ